MVASCQHWAQSFYLYYLSLKLNELLRKNVNLVKPFHLLTHMMLNLADLMETVQAGGDKVEDIERSRG